ncbi:hypothetical protein Tco_0106545, partial [Tanacetum coccineum]
TVSDEGAGTSPEVPDETKDKSEALDDLDDWGSTNDETFLFDDKDEKAEDIPWVSTDEDESNDDEEEDDDSIDIEKTDTDVEDQVMGVAKMNIAEKAEKEKADEEFKGDDQAADAQPKDDQVRNLDSVTHKDKSELLQSTSSHSLSSNFANQFLNNSPNTSLIGTIPENAKAEINSLLDIQIKQEVPNIQQEPFHAVKVSVIPEPTQIPPSTPPAPPLPATVIPSAPAPNSEAFNDVVQRVSELEKDVKELKQVDHSTAILESIKSEVPEAVNKYLGSTLGDTLQKVLQRHTEELRHEFSQKTISQTHTEELHQQVPQDDVS